MEDFLKDIMKTILDNHLREVKLIIKEVPEPDIPWISNDKLAEKLGVSKRQLRYYREKGQLAYTREGKKIWYSVSDINEFMERNHGNN
ncbi:helix-turn-helix domain-containing protein [Balneola sp. MJW-20]|uniref:helix-turn-helix domain-containing protein n=1 Tax=Gracilimonas aurantiaca TaxID=3234185 RepID=UPI0034673C80